MITDHILALAKFAASNISECRDVLLTNYAYKSMTRFNSVLLTCLLEFLTSESKLAAPDRDLTLTVSREIISEYTVSKRNLSTIFSGADIEFVFQFVSQLPLSESYHHKLCVVASLLSIAAPQYTHQLRRFCRSHEHLLSLPIIHGKASGSFLQLIYLKSHIPTQDASLELLRSYLIEAVVLSSVDLEEFFEALFKDSVASFTLVDLTISDVICAKPKYIERYFKLLYDFKGRLSKVIDNTPLSNRKVNMIRVHHSVCQVLSIDGTGIYFDAACESIKSESISLTCRLRIAEEYLKTLDDDNMSNELAKSLTSIEISPLCDATFSTHNKTFINSLFKALPNATAKTLLCCIKPTPEDCDNLNDYHNIPLEVLPKLVPKLNKKQVITTLRSDDAGSPELLSECMLSLAHASYPPHIFSLVFDKVFCALSLDVMEYTSSPSILSNVSRTCELLVKQKAAMRHHAPYILMSIFEHISTCKSPQLVKDATPIIYILFGVCTSHSVQFLQTRLVSGAKQLFVQLHKFYDDNIKYDGKI